MINMVNILVIIKIIQFLGDLICLLTVGLLVSDNEDRLNTLNRKNKSY